MPYIKQEDRQEYGGIIDLLDLQIDSPGSLNYVFSSVIWRLFVRHNTYTKANELLGVLEAVKLEFYRRQVAALEDEKIKENGDLDV